MAIGDILELSADFLRPAALRLCPCTFFILTGVVFVAVDVNLAFAYFVVISDFVSVIGNLYLIGHVPVSIVADVLVLVIAAIGILRCKGLDNLKPFGHTLLYLLPLDRLFQLIWEICGSDAVENLIPNP